MDRALHGFKKSLSDLSDDELRQLLLETRSNRRVVKQKTVERAQKAAKEGTLTKANMRQTIRGLSAEQAAELLAALTGGD